MLSQFDRKIVDKLIKKEDRNIEYPQENSP